MESCSVERGLLEIKQRLLVLILMTLTLHLLQLSLAIYVALFY